MNHSNPSHNIPSTDWQILGELKLPVSSSTEDSLHTWLAEVLDPLDLHAPFLNQILQSAQEATRRAIPLEPAAELRHLHFLVHALKHSDSNGQTWGFFQIEKIGDSTEGGNSHDHPIEFYLYLEG